jgi:septum formation protein
MGLWLNPDALVLASKSAARRSLLEAAGIPVEIRPADIDERGIEASAPPGEPGAIASLLAEHKAIAISRGLPGRLVVGADQTLSFDQRRFSKPADRPSALLQLKTLRGRSHQLYSGAALSKDGVVVARHVTVATLTMRDVSDEFLQRYLDAAGYQLEGLGVQLFERIDGDHFTILGLPLLPLLASLRDLGALA